MSDRKRVIYRIQWVNKTWRLQENSQDLQFFNTKAGAVSFGRTRAKSNKPSQLVVHKRDGKIQIEYTYGNDPERYKG
ncbi:MAG: DUF2188 domain-containing protein [Crenarchaeota archaeon]|nr:MAG: DUF2188 domain-containing protein [Thermoproteota archaeon]